MLPRDTSGVEQVAKRTGDVHRLQLQLEFVVEPAQLLVLQQLRAGLCVPSCVAAEDGMQGAAGWLQWGW